MAIEKWPADSVITVGLGGGRVYLMIDPNSLIYTATTIDWNNDGRVDEVYIELGMGGGQLINGPATQEMASSEFGFNEILDPIFNNFSVLYSANSSATYYPSDEKFRKIAENIAPLTELEDYLTGVESGTTRNTMKSNDRAYVEKLKEFFTRIQNNPHVSFTREAKEFFNKLMK